MAQKLEAVTGLFFIFLSVLVSVYLSVLVSVVFLFWRWISPDVEWKSQSFSGS